MAENAVESEKVQPEKPKPKLRIADYKIPVEGILQKYDNGEYWIVDDETKKKACDLAQTLAEFNIEVKVTGKAGTDKNPNTCTAKITFATHPIMRKSPCAGMYFNGQG